MSLDKTSKVSIRSQWAQQHAVQAVKEELKEFETYFPVGWVPGVDAGKVLPPVPPDFQPPKLRYPPPKLITINIGIIGAGVAGLFAAKVLDYLNYQLFIRALEESKPGEPKPTSNEFLENYVTGDDDRKLPNMLFFKYRILEAAGEERVGGRLFTYEFGEPKGPHDYYDVGAMRFPDNPVMTRTFDLFSNLNMKITDFKNNQNAPLGSIIPYYMQNMNDNGPFEPWCYNNITRWGSYSSIQSKTQGHNPFRMSGIPTTILDYPPDKVMNAAIQRFRDALREDPHGRKGWDLLMEYDTYSTREFLGKAPPPRKEVPPPASKKEVPPPASKKEVPPPASKKELPPPQIPPPPYNYETIQWMETFNGGTDWYDQAHSETVLESMDFEYPSDKDSTKWYCILGGAQQLAKILQDRIHRKPQYNHRVTSIAATGLRKVDVTASIGHSSNDTDTATKSFRFNAVLNTTALGCLRHMDLSRAGLPYPTTLAMRSLGYGPAAKVAIKFSRAWWIHDLQDHNIRRGGLGHSDLNLRTCVYPSYNIYDPKTSSAVLLCSYTWQQDAQRIGSLTSSSPNITHEQKVADEADLKTLLLHDLARLHRSERQSEADLLELISSLYVDHHAHDWSADPHAAGAFAFFRPQQFTHLWNHLIRPAGDVIIAGEAASPHHAWVVGALESVVHGLHAWMHVNAREVPELQAAAEILARAETGNPHTGLPPYMTERLSEWQGLLGYLGRLRHLGVEGAELDALWDRLAKLRLQGEPEGNEAKR